MIKDFLGNECEKGDFFAYPTMVGRSASMNVYLLVGLIDGKLKAIPLQRGCGGPSHRVYDEKLKGLRDMTPEERYKVDTKQSTLQLFSKRALRLDKCPDGIRVPQLPIAGT